MSAQPLKTIFTEKPVRPCTACSSKRQAEFGAEINIHFRGLENIDHPGVLVFPKILVCLDCGFSRFTTPEPELALLATATPPSAASIRQGNPVDVSIRRKIAL
jgi:hypothetical protein